MKRALGIGLLFLAVVVTADRLFPPPAFPQYSTQVFDARGELLNAFLTPDDKWRLRTRLDHVNPDVMRALLYKEDRWFFLHPGVNPYAVLRALWSNVRSGRRVSGASTITMQLARMLEPAERRYAIKFREMLRALQLELRYSKHELLERYISLLPMGGNIEGVASASWLYFNRPAEKLSTAQSAALAVIPSDPNRLRPDRGTEVLQRRTQALLRRLRDSGLFSDADIAAALGEDFDVARTAPPRRAPHFSLIATARTDRDLLHTTLDPVVQDAAERLLRNHVQRVSAEGVRNGAVLIIDNDSMSVAAWCGSADFDDVATQGQVDGVRAVRSPGSTLKPFLYASAFDEGALTPAMRLLDIPVDYGGYMPENFDASCRGDVSVREALLTSLNIPAVRELARQGVGPFINRLAGAGFRTIATSREHLGLSLILGGCGVTLEELTRAYSMFAREGRLQRLRFFSGETDGEGSAMMTSATAWLVTDILSGHDRPDLPAELRATSRLPRFAWKTGTSYGKRDAWAIGWNQRYTIGVWMGNFSGQGAPRLSGTEMAVPLLIDLFDAIDSRQAPVGRPAEIGRREVCVSSGLLPSDRCTQFMQDYYIEGRSGNQRCDLQRAYQLSADLAMHYCMDCVPDSGTVEKWYPVYDAELSVWFEMQHVAIEKPPPHNPDCTMRRSGRGPGIISPSADYTYYLERDADQQIMLHAASPAGVKRQHWYVDGELHATVRNGEKTFFTPAAKLHRIICMDDAGRSSSSTIRIQYY